MLDAASFSPPAWVTHLVLRGTYLPATVRCIAGDPFRPPSYLRDEFVDTATSLSLKCYIDVRANTYVIGDGPSTLTVILFNYSYWDQEYTPYLEEGQTEQDLIEEDRKLFETTMDNLFSGSEHILFLGPPVDLSSEAWRFLGYWDVQRREDSTVIAVHPERDRWKDHRPDEFQTHVSALEMELPAFTQAVTAAHRARLTEYEGRIGPETDLPMLVTNANQLRQYYTAVGAYDHPEGAPARPPPACGLTVPGQDHNPGLMADCQALLAGKDALRGTATLNWSVDTVITNWDGVTTSGTPSRVTELDLSSESLTGSIPAELGSLFELTKLDLISNSLTGEIPRELGDLSNLTEIRLSGNSLTGCIPYGLKDVATNDLSSLNLLYCPPAPEGLSVGTVAENSVALNWSAVASITKYRVEYRDAYTWDWTVDDDTITGTTHTVDYLQCEMWHQFRVRTYGNGTTYAAAWSDPSEFVMETTGACVDPVFGGSSYAFSVSGDAEVGASVGTVSATIAGGDALSYTIVEGNEDGKFAIDAGTGAITVVETLNYATTLTYTLTVEARVEKRGAATVEVAVSVLPTCDGGTGGAEPVGQHGVDG